jgi:hypothetical protein
VDLLFFAANLIKLVSGAWLPLHGPAERPRLLPLIRQADIEALAMTTSCPTSCRASSWPAAAHRA